MVVYDLLRLYRQKGNQTKRLRVKSRTDKDMRSASNPKRRVPSLRAWLINVHKDLFKIHEEVQWVYDTDSPLSHFERIFLVAEDKRFFRHSGFDPIAFCRAFLNFVGHSARGGGSTIDMQLVRTCTGYRERTIRRKSYETFLAFLIQYRYSKIQILRAYTGCAYMGTYLRGVEEASFKLFGKSSDSLNTKQACVLSALFVYPRPKNPALKWQKKILKRACYIRRVYILREKKRRQLKR